jgi:flagellar basal-body rod protein FlgF
VNSGLYAACAALLARTQSLELAANNLANVNTAGYRAQQATFRSLLTQTAPQSGALARAVNDFAVLGGTRPDLAQGHLERTSNDFDCAVEGRGFFTVQTKAGIRYTRSGNLRLSPKGELTTADGDLVLGTQGPIRLPKGALAISPDGTLSVDGALVGKLKLVEFAPNTSLTSEGATLFSAPAGSELPASHSIVRQGVIEGSNVNPITASVDLIALQRHAELLQRTLSIFDSEFNKIAAEDLPRV